MGKVFCLLVVFGAIQSMASPIYLGENWTSNLYTQQYEWTPEGIDALLAKYPNLHFPKKLRSAEVEIAVFKYTGIHTCPPNDPRLTATQYQWSYNTENSSGWYSTKIPKLTDPCSDDQG